MALHIDLKYLHLISSRLDRFKQRDQFIFNFRCPVCGDSYKHKHKTRGYVYKNGDKLSFTCHNCNSPIGFSGLLKFLDNFAYQEYVAEMYLERNPGRNILKKTIEKVIEKKLEKPSLPFRRLSEFPSNHKAVVWFNERQIPPKYLDEFYYVEKYEELRILNDVTQKKAFGTEPRIIIPYWSKQNTLMAVSCREIENHTNKKYIHMKFTEDDLFFGLDRLDEKSLVYVVEGQIDSLFLDNCIAVGSAALGRVSKLNIPPSNTVLIYDDQPKNKEIVELMGKSIEQGYNVVIWDSEKASKMDINDMVKSGIDVKKLIKERTFSGLMAKLEFSKWRKV